jgi:hypothetical protein
MKTKMIAVLALMIAAFAVPAQAADSVVSWTNATQYEDGTPLGTNLKGTRVEVGTCVAGAFGVKSGELFATAPAATVTFTGQGFGQWCFRAFSQTQSGLESVASNVATKTIAEPKPKAPVISVN